MNVKTKINRGIYVLIGIFLLVSCKPISEEDRRIDQTIKEVVDFVNTNDYLSIVGKLVSAKENIDTLKIEWDVLSAYYMLVKYHGNKTEKLRWKTDRVLDAVWRRKYTIPLYEGFDSLTGIKQAALNLYVGPPEIIPLNELSGFELDVEVDPQYRRKLREEGKLLDIEEIVEGLIKNDVQ